MDEDNRSALEQEVACVCLSGGGSLHENTTMGVTDAYNCIYIYLFHV